MLLKETFYLFLITNFAVIRGKKATPVSAFIRGKKATPVSKGKLMYFKWDMRFSSKCYISLLIMISLISHFLKTAATTLDCCKKNNVHVNCLGLCSLIKPMNMISKGDRHTMCSEYEDVIDACFRPGEPRIEDT